MKNRELDFDDVEEMVRKFRSKWKTKIADEAVRKLTLKPKTGKRRTVYLLERNHDLLPKFDRALKRLTESVDKLKSWERTLAYQKLAIPTFVRGCRTIRHKAYRATSVRKIEPEQARRFLSRLDKELPKKKGVYWVRSITGKRYTLVIRANGEKKEWPFSEWAVLEYIGETSVDDLKWVLKVVQPNLTGPQWAKKHNRKFLGERGKSRLYLQL